MAEQKIIDGVAVTSCFYLATNGLTNHKIPYCREYTNNCKDNPNCYYKQLQREKITNENNQQIVESAENLIYENAYLHDELQRKTAECKKHLKYIFELLQTGENYKNKLQIATEALKTIRLLEIESFDLTESEYETEILTTEFSKNLEICEKALEQIGEE